MAKLLQIDADIRAVIFDVYPELTRIDSGPLS